MSTSKVLVIGASGFVGKAIYKSLSKRHKVFGTYFENRKPGLVKLDIRDKKSVGKIFEKSKPDIVILPAAETNVDLCEIKKRLTYGINVAGTRNIAEPCRKANAKLVYFSTDYIFDGKKGPYKEASIPNPASEYGRQKLKCEQLIRKSLREYIIIRTTVVFGYDPESKNFVMQLARDLKNKVPRKVPVDQYSHPAYIKDLADACAELIEKGRNGIYNVVGDDYLNRYEFALLVCKVFKLDKSLLIPAKTKDIGQRAKRPLKGGLLNDKIKKDIKMKFRPIREALMEISKQFEPK